MDTYTRFSWAATSTFYFTKAEDDASAKGPLKRTEKNKRTRKKTVSKHKTHLLILKHKIRTGHIGCWGSRQTKQTGACLLHPRELSLMKRRFTAFNTWFWSMVTNFAFEYRHCSLLIVDQDLDTLTLMSCSRLSWSQQHCAGLCFYFELNVCSYVYSFKV